MTGAADTLVRLAERCETASGADRDINDAIWATLYPGPHRCQRKVDREPASMRPYTASLDAAMTLVPEGADAAGERFRLEAYNSPGVLAPHVRASAWVAGAARVYAATPALALCAAALRARAASC